MGWNSSLGPTYTLKKANGFIFIWKAFKGLEIWCLIMCQRGSNRVWTALISSVTECLSTLHHYKYLSLCGCEGLPNPWLESYLNGMLSKQREIGDCSFALHTLIADMGISWMQGMLFCSLLLGLFLVFLLQCCLFKKSESSPCPLELRQQESTRAH